MSPAAGSSKFVLTLITLLVGVVGAVIGWAVSAPVFMLLGPAVAVTIAALAGQKTVVDDRLRDVCFVVLGIAVGSGFDADALAAMIRWPLAFVAMAALLWVILRVCAAALVRWFAFEPKAAILAAAPGHLSFVIAVATELGTDAARISITQSVRLLSLTIVVPFVALGLGVEVSANIAPQGVPMDLSQVAALAIGGALLGLVFKRLSIPAPLLMGAMVLSALGHLTSITPGVLPEWLVLPAYLVLGTLIGTRFAGVRLVDLGQGLAAGLFVTGIAVVCAGLGAVPVAWLLGMPAAHVLIAFAPGGLETMIAMGAVLGVVPGFVAACHIARLMVLTVLLPAMLAQAPDPKSQSV